MEHVGVEYNWIPQLFSPLSPPDEPFAATLFYPHPVGYSLSNILFVV